MVASSHRLSATAAFRWAAMIRSRTVAIRSIVPSGTIRVTPRSALGRSAIVAGLDALGGGPFSTILADPPWRFSHRTGKVSPEYRRHARYDTCARRPSPPCRWPTRPRPPTPTCYLWVPNALLADGLAVMAGVGLHLQGQPGVAQGPGRRAQRPAGRGLLLPQRHRAGALRRAGQPAHPRPRAGARSTSSPPASGSTPASRSSSTTSSRRAAPVPTWSCSPATPAWGGRPGATRSSSSQNPHTRLRDHEVWLTPGRSWWSRTTSTSPTWSSSTCARRGSGWCRRRTGSGGWRRCATSGPGW